MVRVTRRKAMKLAGGNFVLPAITTTAAAQRPTVETIVEIPSEQKVPENLAFADDGTLYFGITVGEIWQLTADQTQQTGLALNDATQVTTLPGSASGVEVGPNGTIFVGSQADAGTGVWQVPQNGGDPSLFAVIPRMNQEQVFPNDILYDSDQNRLLVTESFGGRVYEVPLDAANPETAASVWLDADSLATESFGANGLTFGPDGAVFVAVTRATSDVGENVGRLVRVPVADDGSTTDPEVYLESPAIIGADGITTRGQTVYVAANSLNEVVRVTPSKQTRTIASSDDGLVFPSDVVFGTANRQQDDLFICNFANETPSQAAILRTRPNQSN